MFRYAAKISGRVHVVHEPKLYLRMRIDKYTSARRRALKGKEEISAFALT